MADRGGAFEPPDVTPEFVTFEYVTPPAYNLGGAYEPPEGSSEPGDPLTAFPQPGEFTTFPGAP